MLGYSVPIDTPSGTDQRESIDRLAESGSLSDFDLPQALIRRQALLPFPSGACHDASYFPLQVIGGMVWCISLCDIDVDIDLLYEENSTIGQKM